MEIKLARVDSEPLTAAIIVGILPTNENIKKAEFYDEEIDNTIWVINKLLEPIIIVTMAIVVWFIATAIMQPIMNMADTVSNS